MLEIDDLAKQYGRIAALEALTPITRRRLQSNHTPATPILTRDPSLRSLDNV